MTSRKVLRNFRGIGLVLAAAVLLALTPLIDSRPPDARQGGGHDHDVTPMTPEAMKAWIDDFYSRHPLVMQEASAVQGAATFTVMSFRFELNGGTPGQVDTAFIMQNESVNWIHADGFHTVTSGTGFADPQVGALFDVPFSGSGFLTHTYTQAGTFPFFCRPHETLQNMKGVVVVQSVTDVALLPGDVTSIGFTSAPSPLPTRGGVTFRFALARRGQVSARLFDASGRLVADVVDRVLEPGAYASSWDGRSLAGAPVTSGVYYLRLAIPGRVESRRIVVVR